MTTIEERAEEFGKQGCGEKCIFICEEWKDKDGVCSRLASRTALYKSIATEQKAIDHSEEHLNWIIKQYHSWMYHNWHTPIGRHCTFKEWIDKVMEEELI